MTIYSNFFSYISFSLQKYIPTHLTCVKNQNWYRVVLLFFRDTGFRMDSLLEKLEYFA